MSTEICSRHKGKVNITTRDGRPVTVAFADVSGRGPAAGLAQIDDDEVVEAFMSIGLPDFWRPGQLDVDPGNQKTADPGKNPDLAPAELSEESYKTLRNAKELEAALEGCSDVELLMRLIALEANQDKARDSWMKLLDAKLAALQQG